MIYKRKNLKDNNLQLEKPQKMSGFKRLENEMSSDYLISIVETYEKDGTINVTPVTSDHNFSFVEPKLVTEIETKNTLSAVPSYFVLPTFEYLALDWEAKLGQLEGTLLDFLGSQAQMALNIRSFDPDPNDDNVETSGSGLLQPGAMGAGLPNFSGGFQLSPDALAQIQAQIEASMSGGSY